MAALETGIPWFTTMTPKFSAMPARISANPVVRMLRMANVARIANET